MTNPAKTPLMNALTPSKTETMEIYRDSNVKNIQHSLQEFNFIKGISVEDFFTSNIAAIETAYISKAVMLTTRLDKLGDKLQAKLPLTVKRINDLDK